MSQPTPPARPRFLSEADCHDIAQRLTRYASGGGSTTVAIVSTWTGNVRWARNRISTTGEDRENHILVQRNLQGARKVIYINDVSDAALVAAARRTERLARLRQEQPESDVLTRQDSPFRYQDQDDPFLTPRLFFDSTYQLDAADRAEAARHLIRSAADAGTLSAGYTEVSATSTAYITSWGYARYYQYTWAQSSVTVRDPKGRGSGWAGVDWPDWSKIDGERLAATALDKCLRSRNPVAVEPGRYMTILEPQAVCDLVSHCMDSFHRSSNETSPPAPFHKSGEREPPNLGSEPLGLSRLGEKVVDERITISADPMDPELGFPPFAPIELSDFFPLLNVDVYHPATWIEHGVLKNLDYDREYAIKELGRAPGLPNSKAFRMSGGNTSVEEMITTTKRGLLVTRFDQVEELGSSAILCRGYTRDGLWLIENGKISKPVKNMMFVESVLFALNNIEQLGPPQRAFHPRGGVASWAMSPQPVIVPPLKIKDFSFTALSEAI